MWFVALACILITVKLLGLGPVAAWDWWWVLSPLGAAAVWWQIADTTGYTQRKAMEREEQRVATRRSNHLKAMGLDTMDRSHKK